MTVSYHFGRMLRTTWNGGRVVDCWLVILVLSAPFYGLTSPVHSLFEPLVVTGLRFAGAVVLTYLYLVRGKRNLSTLLLTVPILNLVWRYVVGWPPRSPLGEGVSPRVTGIVGPYLVVLLFSYALAVVLRRALGDLWTGIDAGR